MSDTIRDCADSPQHSALNHNVYTPGSSHNAGNFKRISWGSLQPPEVLNSVLSIRRWNMFRCEQSSSTHTRVKPAASGGICKVVLISKPSLWSMVPSVPVIETGPKPGSGTSFSVARVLTVPANLK